MASHRCSVAGEHDPAPWAMADRGRRAGGSTINQSVSQSINQSSIRRVAESRQSAGPLSPPVCQVLPVNDGIRTSTSPTCPSLPPATRQREVLVRFSGGSISWRFPPWGTVSFGQPALSPCRPARPRCWPALSKPQRPASPVGLHDHGNRLVPGTAEGVSSFRQTLRSVIRGWLFGLLASASASSPAKPLLDRTEPRGTNSGNRDV